MLFFLVLLMSLLRDCGSVNITTDVLGTTFTVTCTDADAGTFQPKVIFFWWSGRSDTTDAAGAASHDRGFGWAVSTSDRRCVVSRSLDSNNTMTNSSGHSDAACIITVSTSTDAIDGAIDLDALLSTGFRLIVDDVMPRALRVHWMALGGTDPSFESITFTQQAGTGDQDVQTFAGSPTAFLFLSAALRANPPSGGVWSPFGIGAASGTGATEQACLGCTAEDAIADGITMAYCRDGEVIGLITATDNPNNRATFTSFLANGFRVNWAETDTTAIRHFVLGVSGISMKVFTLLTQTNTTTPISSGSLGMTPKAALYFSANAAEDAANTSHVHDSCSIGGAVSPQNRRCHAVLDEDAVANSDVETAVEHDEVYANLSTSAAIEGLMDVTDFGLDSIMHIMDDADPSQSFVWGLAFGVPTEAEYIKPTLQAVKRASFF